MFFDPRGTPSVSIALACRSSRDVDVSLGTVSAPEKFVSEAVAPLHQEAMAALRRQPVAGVDETGHRREGKRATTWVGTSPEVDDARHHE